MKNKVLSIDSAAISLYHVPTTQTVYFALACLCLGKVTRVSEPGF